MSRGYVSFCNSDQACKTGFGGQQVIITCIQLFGGGVVADVEHLALLIEQEPEIHRHEISIGHSCQIGITDEQGLCLKLGGGQIAG